MSHTIDSKDESDIADKSDIAVGAMVYSRRIGDNQATVEFRRLVELLDRARYGIVIDCQAVEMATSEVLNVFLKISSRAKKAGKHVTLYNVPDSLQKTIKIASLTSVLQIFDDGIKAKNRIYSLRGVDPTSSFWNRKAHAGAFLAAVVALGIWISALVFYSA